jgi:outer membrane protein assembly factor BamB
MECFRQFSRRHFQRSVDQIRTDRYRLSRRSSICIRYSGKFALDVHQRWSYRSTLYITSTDNLLHALSPSGTLQWTFPTGGQLRGSPTIAPDGSILVCSDDGYLYAIRSDGALRWKKNLHAPLHGTAAVTPEGRILCVTSGGDLVSVDEHGDEEWRTSFAQASTLSNAIVDVNGCAYVGGPDGMLSAFGRYGNFLWRFETGGPIQSTPSIAQDGSIAVGSDDGYMYLIGER